MVVVPASPLDRNCPHCGSILGEGYLERHLCSNCLKPLPLAAGEAGNYFEALGVPERFGQDAAELQKRFYEISRALHPDRFTAAGARFQQLSLERMSLINEAYRVLKDREALRNYLLKRHGVAPDAKQGQIPAELAEGWFELQDLLMENGDRAGAKLGEFEQELRQVKDQVLRDLGELEKQYDAGANSLSEIGRRQLQLNYLKSMERDIERLRKRIA